MTRTWISKMADGVFRLSDWGTRQTWRPGTGTTEHRSRRSDRPPSGRTARPRRALMQGENARVARARRRRDRVGGDRHAA